MCEEPSSRLARCEQVNKPTVGHVTYVPPEAAAALKMTDEADSAALREDRHEVDDLCEWLCGAACYAGDVAAACAPVLGEEGHELREEGIRR